MSDINYMVSVRLMTYNHELFIREAMEGIFMQKTDFLVEVVVGDDFSNDRTLEIIKSFNNTANIHIKILDRKVGDEYWEERQTKGRLFNFTNILSNCSGKYIAILDGDDYWTDPYKLKKQVNFLDHHPDLVLCAHKRNIHGEGIFEEPTNEIVYFDQALLYNYHIPTLTAMFRNIKINFPNDFYKAPYGDFFLWVLLGNSGRFAILPDVMANYRRHEGGVWSGISRTEQLRKSILSRKIASKYMRENKMTINSLRSRSRGYFLKCIKEFDFRNGWFFFKEMI